MTAHICRYLRHYRRSGHVWQGRFKAFPVQDDDHLRVALRYVERNPLRAGLVDRAEGWPWSSMGDAAGPPTTRSARRCGQRRWTRPGRPPTPRTATAA